MAEHRWGEPDKDGVPTCARNGCTVRYNGGSYWQRKRGGHWRNTHDEPLPACTGTDAPEATRIHTTAPCRKCGECGGRHSAACDMYAPEATLRRRCVKCAEPFDGPARETLLLCQRCSAGQAKEQRTRNVQPTPSPLDVVRKALESLGGWSLGASERSRTALSALATLEESIRAEEREACAKVAQEVADSWRDAIPHATDAAMRETATWAERACMDVAHSIRSRGNL